MSDYTLSQKCLSEALGTFILVAGGCGTVCAIKYGKYPSSALVIPVAFGFSVATAVYATRDISGGHINPSMTMAFAVNRSDSFPKSHVLPYIGSQLTGATAAAFVNYILFKRGIKELELKEALIRGSKGSAEIFNGAFGMIPNRTLLPKSWMVAAAEFGMTAALSYNIFAFVDEDSTVPSAAAPALIGGLVTALCLPFISLTGCGMNPARDLGPRLATFLLGWKMEAFSKAWWAYSFAPILGGVFGGAFYDMTLKKKRKEKKH